MICTHTVKSFCKEEISKIENYELAINDDIQTWECHHRRETDEGLSVKQLIELGLYYGRPASELIFLTPSEHKSLHQSGKHKSEETKQRLSESHKGIIPWNKGKKTGPLSKEHKQNLSDANKGQKSPIKGKHIVWDDKENNKYHFEF